jgi:hypothetical protein
MKKVFLFMVFVAIFMETSAQSNEPEFIGTIVYLDSTFQTPLEKQKAVIKAKAGASMYITGVGKVTGINYVTGVRSNVRVKKKQIVSFVVRVKDNNVDPFTIVNIFRLEQNVKKDHRFINVASQSTFGGSKSGDILFIPFTGKKFGLSSFLVELSGAQAGEYAITLDGSRDIFSCFGID